MEGKKMEDTQEIRANNEQVLELGIMLGQRRAFGMIAGRCSAAQAECLRKIREQKQYLKFAPNWEEYCVRRLKISSRTADRMIALLKKHGPLYFETAALTGISPAEFARLKHAIQADGIHVGGEVIALIAENAERAVDAVAQLQAEAAAAVEAEAGEAQDQDTVTKGARVRELEARARKLHQSFHQTAKTADCIERMWLIATIKRVQALFTRLELEIT
jgi:hypothetical protein